MDNQNKYDNINFYFIQDQKLLFFDIFARDNMVIIVSPIYLDYNIKYNDIVVIHNNKKLTNNNNFTNKNYMKSELFYVKIFELNNTSSDFIDIKLKYENITLFYNLHHYKSNKKFFLITSTLFKNDFKLFKPYYDYYTKQGVEFFYMYYNGILNDEIRSYFNYSNVKLFEWNFEYWHNNNLGEHVAQLGQICHYLYKYGKNLSKYVILNDLDEYMYVEKMTLKKLLINNAKYDYFMFLNYWCKTLDDKIPIDDLPSKIIKENENLGKFYRTKCIYKTRIINFPGIHVMNTQKQNDNYYSNNLMLLHFSNWSNENRFIDISKSSTFDIYI